ncbi:MAG TPA: hypothetical protein VHJ20_19015 [Polyangia bacterium]|nr:hypothetical protein [Polyangia bacterium]
MIRVVAFVALAGGIATLAACTSTPPILPQRDFDRPTDITFVCMGGKVGTEPPAALSDGGTYSPLHLTGQPMRACHPRLGATPNDPPASATHRTFAFLPNSNSGELTVIDADNWSLVDLDPKTAGFGLAPLGVLPEQIASSDDGCRLVTANHGSCDFSVVDPSALLAPTMHVAYPDVLASTGNPVYRRVQPRTASGRVLALNAGEIAFLPQRADTIPNACPDDWSGRALVTFPSCGLVALIDLPSGTIVDSHYVRSADGGKTVQIVAAGNEPVCPVVDCGVAVSSDAGPSDAGDAAMSVADGSADGAAPDGASTDVAPSNGDASADAEAGAAEAGAEAPTTTVEPDPSFTLDGPTRPFAIALNPYTNRAYVGLTNAPFVLAFDVDRAHAFVPTGGPTGTGVIGLAEGAIGATRLRLSIDPYLDSGDPGKEIAGSYVGTTPDPNAPDALDDLQDRQYLYVIARDGSVRVVGLATGIESECETNLDPGLISGTTTNIRAACLPVDPTHRRATAVGPGIRLPSPPVDVAFADIRNLNDHSETSTGGVYAWVVAANGNTYLVNINPVLRAISYYDTNGKYLACSNPVLSPDLCQPEPSPPPNSRHDSNFLSYSRALDPSSGPPRLEFAPTAGVTGPRIENIWTRGSAANQATISSDFIRTGVFFPTGVQPVAQTWSVTWEGALLSAPRFSGQLVLEPNGNSAKINATARLVDPGMDFCRAGLQPNDLVTLVGCVTDQDCGTNKVCTHGTEGTEGAASLTIGGLCLPSTTPATACDWLLKTVRRYDARPIGADTALTVNAVELLPHKDELVLPNQVKCKKAGATNADGGVDAGGGDGSAGGAGGSGADDRATTLASLAQTCVDPTDPSTANFGCFENNTRCWQPCTQPGSVGTCRAGRICVRFPAQNLTGSSPMSEDTGSCGTADAPTCFCADGPDLTKVDVATCLGELFPYQLSVGGGYVVSGTASGTPLTQAADGAGHCQKLASLDPRQAGRISLRNTDYCPTSLDETFNNLCDPNVTPVDVACRNDAASLLTQETSPFSPNPCLFIGGASDTDASLVGNPRHVQAMFRNSELSFMMTNLEQPIANGLSIAFDVSGGTRTQNVTLPADVEITMPARIVVGPFDSRDATSSSSAGDVPYLFVVDQRRLGRVQGSSPARGQLLRIHPRGNPITSPKVGSQPIYQDLSDSNNLFPIQ